MGASQVRHAVTSLHHAMRDLVPEEVPLRVAAELARELSTCERQLSALRMALTRRVTQAGAHRAEGDRDAVSYVARLTGSSRAAARRELELSERLEELPAVEKAVADGRISTEQAKVIVPAVEADPEAAGELLAAAEQRSFSELRELSVRRARAARSDADQVARERRAHLRRYCRTWAPEDGGLRIDAWVTTLDGAKLLAALCKKTEQLLTGAEEPVERLRADALVALVTGEQVAAEVCVRVDAEALLRGEVEGDERCDIPGLGPVSVEKARSLLGDALWTLVVTRGADIATVTSTSRVVPRRVRKALEERDRCCVVPGCGTTMHLEIDHWRVDFARGGLTELDNLCRLCSVHHKMKTEGHLRIDGGPGKWRARGVGPPARAGPSSPRAGRAARRASGR